MTAPAPPRRRHGVLLIWCGGVAMVLAGAFTLAWWKLPEWQPDWVIDHSPWAEPAVRAMLHAAETYDLAPADRLMAWGAAIGPHLRERFRIGSTGQRAQILVIADLVLREPDEIDDHHDAMQLFIRRRDGSALSPAEAGSLREDVGWMIDEACADGGTDLREIVVQLIDAMPEPRWMPILCRWARESEGTWQFARIVRVIARGGDPGAVPHLLPLLATSSDHEQVAFALRQCIAAHQTREVAAAAHDGHPRVRAWAASVIHRMEADPALRESFLALTRDPEVIVRRAAVESIVRQGFPPEVHAVVHGRLQDPATGLRAILPAAIPAEGIPQTLQAAFLGCIDDPEPGIRNVVISGIAAQRLSGATGCLVERLGLEQELFLRLAIIDALEALSYPGMLEILRRMATTTGDPARGAALVALGQRGDMTCFPLLVTLLQSEDDALARKARIALGHLPLTLEQQRQVDALWEALEDVPEPAPEVTSPASPAIP